MIWHDFGHGTWRTGEQETPAISAVNMIVGAEEFLAERQRFAIVHAARKNAGDPDLPVELHKATNLSEPQLIELLSPSLFAEDRIVVISGVADCGKETVALLKSAIETPADGVVLILLHSGKGRNKRLVNEWQKLGYGSSQRSRSGPGSGDPSWSRSSAPMG
ncbi:hypothetical protein [Corynebacterium urealyticum]|uniref:hypothetical protein n=1 Tax=Corynebacterium urealyticum TaxID=43771 RepID=UPI00293EFE48|nr:hypothetical protein [Corynebacterium urealyticum]WOH93906.1 hypothetical protein RZ943_07405 [Corynebacterium urealyticum]